MAPGTAFSYTRRCLRGRPATYTAGMAKTTAKKTRLGRGLSSLLNVEPEKKPQPAQTDAPAAPVMRETPADPAPGPTRPPSPAAEPEPAATQPAAPDGRPLEVPVDRIDPNPHQPRRSFDEAELNELAASLKTNGLIQPIVVRPSPTEGRFELIAGERRLRASKLAGFKTIQVVVRETDAMTQAQLALVENIQRSDLNPLERAESYRTLLDQLGLTVTELATRLGEDRSTVSNHLRLLDLAEPVRLLIRDRVLSLGHAKVLAGVEDEAEQVRLAKLVAGQELSVRNLEKLVADPAGTPGGGSKQEPTPAALARQQHLSRVSDQIGGVLGTRVEVKGKKGGRGQIVIHYRDLDAFDDLLRRMNVELDD